MKYEDCESVVSKYVSRGIEYFDSTNITGIASLLMSIIWILAGASVFFGYSALNASIAMIVSYLMVRIVGHFDDSSESQARTGMYSDIREHDPDTKTMCTKCAEEKEEGTLKVTYRVFYLMDYELGRAERTRNLTCEECEESVEDYEDDKEVNMSKE